MLYSYLVIAEGAAEGIGSIRGGLVKSSAGMDGLSGGITKSEAGLDEIAAGIEKAGSALKKIQSSMLEMADSQAKAGTDISGISAKLAEISKGLGDSAVALKKMEDALDDIQNASNEYSETGSPLSDVFFLPTGILDKYPDLKKAMDNYISPDGLKGTQLKDAVYHVGGATAILSEVREVTSADFTLVIVLVLLGIFVVLVILLRSLIAPVYLILTIIFSYITTMGITSLVFQVLLGYDGLHWSVEFFSFCILVALGVDYNIFLMSRIKEEYKPGDNTGGIARALTTTGGIITSCGIIMAGTFGAMMSSSVRPLLEIGFAATVGLLLDTFIIRCLLVPAIAVKFGEVNWWPGRKLKVVPLDKEEQKP
jgi:RND superfamily putative drug exporter